MPSGRALSGIECWGNKKQHAAVNWNYALTPHVAIKTIADIGPKSQAEFF
jgi:hypothetical protein